MFWIAHPSFQWVQNDAFNVPTKKRVNGVFVIKVSRVEHVGKTLCSLTRFFNADAKYPVRIFSDHADDDPDHNYTFEIEELYAGGADVQVIVDTQQRWTTLPSILTETERAQALAECENFANPDNAMCTSMKFPLGYVHMIYWRYYKMAEEPALQNFEYFVLFDDDAFLTETMPDPFFIMETNNLTGIFNIEAFQSGDIAEGIQEASEAVFSLEERRNR
jgi:hypothetical protein